MDEPTPGCSSYPDQVEFSDADATPAPEASPIESLNIPDFPDSREIKLLKIYIPVEGKPYDKSLSLEENLQQGNVKFVTELPNDDRDSQAGFNGTVSQQIVHTQENATVVVQLATITNGGDVTVKRYGARLKNKPRTHTCQKCNMNFRFKYEFDEHNLVHRKKRPYNKRINQ